MSTTPYMVDFWSEMVYKDFTPDRYNTAIYIDYWVSSRVLWEKLYLARRAGIIMSSTQEMHYIQYASWLFPR